MRFGELAALGVAQGEELLGTELAGPVDVFIYDSREDFFGALGPGAREWTGAVAYNEIRTIFMWLGGGPADYLETAMVHEITHIVFLDATDNPFHDPGTWINEGIAVWSETGDAADETAFVRSQASAGGLFAFEAITERFPIGDLAGSLSYAQGAAMIDYIIDTYGEEAIARLTAAYRDGASDEEALEAATGVSADELYGAFYAAVRRGSPHAGRARADRSRRTSTRRIRARSIPGASTVDRALRRETPRLVIRADGTGMEPWLLLLDPRRGDRGGRGRRGDGRAACRADAVRMTSRLPARPRQLFRPQWTVSMAAALAAIGFVGAAQWNSSLGREEFISSAQSVLVSQAEQLQREQERMLAEIEQAEADLQVLQERDSGSQTALALANERLLAARVAAGAEDMRGPGVVVEIADSLRDRPAGEPQQNFIVLVSDLRDIVTAL